MGEAHGRWSHTEPVGGRGGPLRRVGPGASGLVAGGAVESTDVTQIYLHADMTIKENALARLPATRNSRGRYRPPDKLLDYLNSV